MHIKNYFLVTKVFGYNKSSSQGLKFLKTCVCVVTFEGRNNLYSEKPHLEELHKYMIK